MPADQAVFDALQASLDELSRMRDVVNQGGQCKPARELMNRIRALGGYAPIEEPVAAVASLAPASPAAPAPVPVIDDVVVEYPLESDATSSTDIVPTLTEEAVTEQAGDAEEIEFDVEFGADELGAAAPREAVRFDEPVPSAATGAHATLDVASLTPELPPDASPDVRMLRGWWRPMSLRMHASSRRKPCPKCRWPCRVASRRRRSARNLRASTRTCSIRCSTMRARSSIFRSRMEQQISSIEFNLAELGRTVTRLKEQLRKLKLETEAQILHRHEEEHPGRADFDPLELDRYSTIQQLSRAFAESVSDVSSIEGLLENLTREAQNLLLQQSRVVTEMQNGLMRTRMVPFQRHVQRLSRLVRQVASDTGKRAELIVVGASGELDRQVLDRMLPPFEHMLRNSVVHGIETPQERLAAGKPEGGTIKVGLHREGAEMVIVLEDDGRGIDVNAVRERAKARGILRPGRILS